MSRRELEADVEEARLSKMLKQFGEIGPRVFYGSRNMSLDFYLAR